MGILEKLKSLFVSEKMEEETVSLEELEGWFKERSSSRIDFLNGQIQGINEKIGQEIEGIKTNTERLRNATLRNPNIPERAKHFMEGNRDAYIKNSLMLADSIKLAGDAKELGGFFEDFKKKIEEYGKATARPYQILREFFEDEASSIASNVRNIDNYAKEIKSQREKAGMKDIELASRLISSLFSKMKRKEELEKELTEKKRQLELSKQDSEKIEKAGIDMRESQEMKTYAELQTKLEALGNQIKEKEEELRQPFSVLERPLRKFERSVAADKDVLDAYMDSAIRGITQDFGLKILRILDNMKKAAQDNSLELKDKQREVVIREIEKLDKDFLGKFQTDYGRLKKEEGILKSEINAIDIMKRIAKNEEDLRIKKSLLKTLEHSILTIDEELKKIDLEVMKKAIAEKVKDCLRIKMDIS